MQKIFRSSMLGCCFLLCFGLYVNAATFTIPAPQNLSAVILGDTWVQIAWDEIAGASGGYEVTTRIAATNALVSSFIIDRTDVVIGHLQTGTAYNITVLGRRGETRGEGSTIIITPHKPVVFDLVLNHPGTKPEIECDERCSFLGTALSKIGGEVTYECDIYRHSVTGDFLPVWIKVELNVSPNPFPDNYVIMYVEFQHQVNTSNYHIPVQYYQAQPRPWEFDIDTPNPYIMYVSTRGATEVARIHFDMGNEQIFINLPEDYILTVLEACELEELRRNTEVPQIHETLTSAVANNTDQAIATPQQIENSVSSFRVTNPVKDELVLFFEKPTEQAAKLELYTASGALVEQHLLPEGVSKHSLPCTQLVAGIYLLRMHTESGVQTRLIVKQ